MVLEAMQNTLPVVCLDLGGPSVIVSDTCGYLIATNGCTENDVVSKLGNALLDYSSTKDTQENLSQGVIKRAGQMRWSHLVNL